LATTEIFFAHDHPVGPGHFPGNPIIPGALLLAEVLQAIAAQIARPLLVGTIKSAKFSFPARPGERVAIDYSESVPGQIQFQCTVGEKTVLTGSVKCVAPSTPA
jgi:3-hydroxyacyl-[acyl-carrier-protein] dehydratase